jgi:hypothetical protein
MPGTTVRLSLAAAGLAVVGLVGGATAAPATATGPKSLVLSDPSGDAVPGMTGDITKVTYTTSGTTTVKKVGKRSVATYTPKALVVSMVMADAIDTTGAVVYEADAKVDGCGTLSLYAQFGVTGAVNDPSGGLLGCGGSGSLDPTGAVPAPAAGLLASSSTSLTVTPTVVGKTITWTLDFSEAPAVLKAGASITGFDVYTALSDPVLGFGPYLFDSTFYSDQVASDSTYKIG